MRANWPWRVRLGVLEHQAGRQKEEQAPTTPETDTGGAARALTTHTDFVPLRDNERHGRKRAFGYSEAERLHGGLQVCLSLSPYLASVQWSRKAGPGRTPSERTTDGDGDGTGTGRFFHSYRGLGWVGGEVREAREGMIGGRQGEVR